MKWIFAAADPGEVRLLAAQLQSDPVLRDAQTAATLARLLVLRGIKKPKVRRNF